jgi:sorting nexin-9/18/33
MATLPRTTKANRISPTSSVALFNARPQSEFDAGINTSFAWTEHLERGSSTELLSDEEPDDEGETGRPARALYLFSGKAEFRELSVEAGDELEVVKEEVGDGWSLVKNKTGECGLLPRTYYTASFLSC